MKPQHFMGGTVLHAETDRPADSQVVCLEAIGLLQASSPSEVATHWGLGVSVGVARLRRELACL